jgi:membrane-bound lytic murein transglycosylase MltF
VTLAHAAGGCGGSTANAPAGGSKASPPPPAYEADLPEGVRAVLSARLVGDLDQMVARRLIRVGVTFNRTFYFTDAGVQRGVAYELGKAFEDELNQKLKTGNMKVYVVFVPLPRDALASALTEGKVDLVAAQMTIRPQLREFVDFTNPTRTNISEVVVTGHGAAIGSVDDLSGKNVYTRKDSKYYQSLVSLNEVEGEGEVARNHPGSPR